MRILLATIIIITLPLAAQPSEPHPLSLRIWDYCSGYPTQALRQQCLQQQVSHMNSIVARGHIYEPELTAECIKATGGVLVATVACLAEGLPL